MQQYKSIPYNHRLQHDVNSDQPADNNFVFIADTSFLYNFEADEVIIAWICEQNGILFSLFCKYFNHVHLKYFDAFTLGYSGHKYPKVFIKTNSDIFVINMSRK